MDATPYRELARIQSSHGLYPIQYLVFWKNFFPDIRDHVVPVDVSQVAYRSIAEFGVEIFITDQYVEFIIGYIDGHYGLVFLI